MQGATTPPPRLDTGASDPPARGTAGDMVAPPDRGVGGKPHRYRRGTDGGLDATVVALSILRAGLVAIAATRAASSCAAKPPGVR